MGKNRIIFSLICLSLAVCSCSGEKNYLKDARELKTTISFDQLQDIAIEPVNEDKNYNLKATNLGTTFNDFCKVECLGSVMYTCYDNSINHHKLFAVNDSKSISYTLQNNILTARDYNSNHTDLVITDDSYPIAIFEENINTTDHQTVFVDCYGNVLKRANIEGKKTIKYEKQYVDKDYTYFFISVLSSYSATTYNFYFKYTKKDGKYIVSAMEAKEFNDSLVSFNTGEILEPWFDRKGNIFAYTEASTGAFCIYDKNKNFVNSIYSDAFYYLNSAEDVATLKFEKKMYVFTGEEYYANVNEKSSKKSFKCTCLEVDIETGKVTYDDDFKYYIIDSNTVTYDNKYCYTYFTYFELNDKGEKGNKKMCSIAKECLSFENSFVYDGFAGEAFNVNRNAVVAQFGSFNYICTKNERRGIGQGDIRFAPNNKIIYGKYSPSATGKCFICDRKEFVEYSKNPLVVYEYISWKKYYGDYLFISSDSISDTYKCTNNTTTLDVNSSFINYVDAGFIINNNGIFLPNGEMVFSSVGNPVLGLSREVAVNNVSIFGVHLYDSSVFYILLEETLA